MVWPWLYKTKDAREMPNISLKDIENLSIPERILLVEDIWDSVAAAPDSVPLTQAERELLDQRLEAHRKNPEAGSPWHEVKSRIQSGTRPPS